VPVYALVALVALLVAAPTAGAASFKGGTFKLDLKTLANAGKLKVKSDTLSVRDGTATLTRTSTGSFGINGGVKLTKGSKTFAMTGLLEKLASGKGSLTATVNGKAVKLFDEQSTGKLTPAADFTGLALKSSNLKLTKAGAAALNKAFPVKGKSGQKPKPAFKAGQSAGKVQFDGDRVLKLASGNVPTIYDSGFYNTMTGCGIQLSAIAPATEIPADPNTAPTGGVNLPVLGGTLTADTLSGGIDLDGGTRLNRPEGSPQGAAYQSDLTKYQIATNKTPPALSARVSRLANQVIPIGTVEGLALDKALTADGGAITFAGTLALSDLASQTLSGDTGCNIPAGTKIGTINGSAAVK
jgi:hypothetical protein